MTDLRDHQRPRPVRGASYRWACFEQYWGRKALGVKAGDQDGGCARCGDIDNVDRIVGSEQVPSGRNGSGVVENGELRP